MLPVAKRAVGVRLRYRTLAVGGLLMFIGGLWFGSVLSPKPSPPLTYSAPVSTNNAELIRLRNELASTQRDREELRTGYLKAVELAMTKNVQILSLGNAITATYGRNAMGSEWADRVREALEENRRLKEDYTSVKYGR